MALNVSIQRRLKGFCLDVAFKTGTDVLGILGPSGSGKSMTLRSIAGIDPVHAGQISLDGRILLDVAKRVNLPPKDRKVGYLFQSGALFPHMTVAQNIEAALGTHQRQKLLALLERFQIEGLEKRFPSQLSGGQAQRVALARCIATEPKALLLDEPFSALDSQLREQMQWELLDMLRDYPGQTVLVTHDQREAYRLCGQLAIFYEGRCIATGKTRSMFADPGLVQAARLTGCRNISKAQPVDAFEVLALDWGLRLRSACRVPQDLDAVGIREQSFLPVASAAEANAFGIVIKERLDDFGSIGLRVTPAKAPQASPLWVRLPPSQGQGLPAALQVAPRDVLLLREGRFGREARKGR